MRYQGVLKPCEGWEKGKGTQFWPGCCRETGKHYGSHWNVKCFQIRCLLQLWLLLKCHSFSIILRKIILKKKKKQWEVPSDPRKLVPFPNEVALKPSPCHSSSLCAVTALQLEDCIRNCSGSSISLQILNELWQTAPCQACYIHLPRKHCSLEKAFDPLTAKSHYIAFDAKAIKVSYCFKLTISQCCKGAWTSSGRRHRCFWNVFRAPAFHF